MTSLLPPTAGDVQRRFHHPAVVVTRPLIMGSVKLLCAARSFDFKATGLEELERVEHPVILAANHQSHADTPAILYTLPRAVRTRTAVAAALDVFGTTDNGNGMPSMKREALQLVVAAGFHAFAFDRLGAPRRSLRTAAQLIRQGWNILLYPEGTRSRTGVMAPFKAGVGALARITRRPVMPIYVTGGQGVLPCGTFVPRAGRVLAHYGPPLHHRRGESLPAFAARLQEAVRALAEKRN